MSTEQILITNGAQNAIELVLKLLTEPGREVVVESPTYFRVWPLLNYYQTRIVEIPMKKNGMSLTHLEKILQNHRPAFICTMPNFHNPTGITTDHLHREKLLHLAEDYKTPIVEDAFEEEMKYFGRVPLPIKSMDNKGMVIYLGTFSKVFAPGLRIGWIAAERDLIVRLAAVKEFSDLSSNSLIQSALFEFCQQGFYDRHIKRMHWEYKKRMQVLITNLRKNFTAFRKASWNEPSGGYLTWIHLKDTNMEVEELMGLFQIDSPNLETHIHRHKACFCQGFVSTESKYQIRWV